MYMLPYARPPLILSLKVVFGKLLPVPKSCKKNLAQCASMMTGTVCFEERTIICNAKFGDLDISGTVRDTDRAPNVNLGPPEISETTRAKMLKLKTQL